MAGDLIAELEEEYAATRPRSAALFRRQSALVPGGITHSLRALTPFPLFVERCRGAHKWDVDGHRYVDYWMGHGANLLGYGPAAVLEALGAQAERGSHGAGETEFGLRWAELVCRMVPSAEAVRFTASGGEATQLALRLARAATGKDRVVKFSHNFHGWHDAVTYGFSPPWERSVSAGVPASTTASVSVLPFNDEAALARFLSETDDVAGVIVEAGGALADTIPIRPAFLRALREETSRRGVVLILDEVVTGFRYAPGGVQEYFGVLPDLTALGKIMGGGLAAGAVAGRSELLAPLGPRADAGWMRSSHVPQQGTWNANPLSAAAGVATLQLLADGALIDEARSLADDLRSRLNATLREEGVEGLAYGRSSIWRVHLGRVPGALRDRGDPADGMGEVAHPPERLARALRLAMLLGGVDLMLGGGFLSTAHTEQDVETTVAAFRRALRRLGAGGLLGPAPAG